MPSAKLFTRQRLVCYHRAKAIPPISRTESTVIKTSGTRLTILAAGIFVFVLAFSAIFASRRRIKQKPPAEMNPPAAKTKILFYAETSFSSEEDFDEPSVTTFIFENVVDSISFLISEHGTRTIRLHEISAASTSKAFSFYTLNKHRNTSIFKLSGCFLFFFKHRTDFFNLLGAQTCIFLGKKNRKIFLFFRAARLLKVQLKRIGGGFSSSSLSSSFAVSSNEYFSEIFSVKSTGITRSPLSIAER